MNELDIHIDIFSFAFQFVRIQSIYEHEITCITYDSMEILNMSVFDSASSCVFNYVR